MPDRQRDHHFPGLQEKCERACGGRYSCHAPYSKRRRGVGTKLPLYAPQAAERLLLLGQDLCARTGTGERERAGLRPARTGASRCCLFPLSSPPPVWAGLRPAHTSTGRHCALPLSAPLHVRLPHTAETCVTQSLTNRALANLPCCFPVQRARCRVTVANRIPPRATSGVSQSGK